MILRIPADHIEYHRQNRAVFPTRHREHRFSSLCGSCRSLELLPLGGDRRFHLNDQFCQFLLTFLLAVGVDITGEAAAVGEPGGVSTFPEVFIDLADAPGAGFAALPLVGLEGGGVGFLGVVSISWEVSDLAIPRSILAAAVFLISSVTWA